MKFPVKTTLPPTTDKEVDFLKKVRLKAWGTAVCLFVIGVLIGIAGIYIGETDDAPGAALIGILLMIGVVVLGVRSRLAQTMMEDNAERGIEATGCSCLV